MKRLKTKHTMLLLFLILSIISVTAQNAVAQNTSSFVEDKNADQGTSSAAGKAMLKSGQVAQAAATPADGNYLMSVSTNGLNAQPTSYAPPVDPYAAGMAKLAADQAAAAKSAQSTQLLGALLPVCISGIGGVLGGNEPTTKNRQSFVDVYNETARSTDAPYTRGTSYALGNDPINVADAKMSMTCDRFIKADGSYGDWGQALAQEIRKYPVYSSKVPEDMPALCPKFSSFTPELKEKFWVHTFASMASNESSCNANNRTAENMGLLQLDEGACGKYVNLFNPQNNLSCGARQLAKELSGRSTLTKNCSRCSGGTYWAVLRSDGTPLSSSAANNSARAREVKGSLKTQKLISGFNGCR